MRMLVTWGLCGSMVLGLAALAPATEPGMEKPGVENSKDADDTARNERDRNDRTLTPMDQGSSAADRTITQDIRKAVVDNDELSTNAKNIKIITVDGVVTLRGPVKNDAEKTTVASIAHKASGVKRVDNQLEVERNP